MNWINLEAEQQLAAIKTLSYSKPQLIFKHSTRCSISVMAKNRLDREPATNLIDSYYLDLLSHRDISNKIAESFGVVHESPQVLLIKNGECTYEESHTGINMTEILEQASAN